MVGNGTEGVRNGTEVVSNGTLSEVDPSTVSPIEMKKINCLVQIIIHIGVAYRSAKKIEE